MSSNDVNRTFMTYIQNKEYHRRQARVRSVIERLAVLSGGSVISKEAERLVYEARDLVSDPLWNDRVQHG